MGASPAVSQASVSIWVLAPLEAHYLPAYYAPLPQWTGHLTVLEQEGGTLWGHLSWHISGKVELERCSDLLKGAQIADSWLALSPNIPK